MTIFLDFFPFEWFLSIWCEIYFKKIIKKNILIESKTADL